MAGVRGNPLIHTRPEGDIPEFRDMKKDLKGSTDPRKRLNAVIKGLKSLKLGKG